MDPVHLPSLADELLAAAREASSGRAGRSIRSGRDAALRQTVMGLAAGRGLDEHEANGEATLQVLSGTVRLRWAGGELEASAGEVGGIPDERHALDAGTEAAVLLTVAVR